jgi:predicted SnoaL-like aldol condensation-catalyzing enzyme
LYEQPQNGEHLSTLIEKRKPIKLHRIIADGNVIAVQSEGKQSGKAFVFYDFMKITDSSPTEHWAVGQEIPAITFHNNGML